VSIPLRVLVVEDSEDDALLLLGELEAGGYEVTHRRVENETEMRAALGSVAWDIVISDYTMPRFSGLAALRTAQELRPDIPFIIISGNIGEDVAAEAVRAGANDYLLKGNLWRLHPAVERELREAEGRRARRNIEDALRDSELRFRTLVSNMPGVVFQMTLKRDGAFEFPYISEGCYQLFGVRPQSLQDNPQLFLEFMVAEDRLAYSLALMNSALQFTTLNWEGRIRATHPGEKWIGLRSSPRRGADGNTVWDGLITNITQSKHAELEIRASREQIGALTSHLETIKEEERAEIARNIHDDVGGTLVAIKIELSWLAHRLPKTQRALLDKAKSIEDLVDRAIAETSRVGQNLRPGILLEFGLAAAIESHAEEFAGRLGIPCKVTVVDADVEIPADLALSLFRIFQETLTNITKHANASRVGVMLGQVDGELRLEVSDDGRGIAREDRLKPSSFGLQGIEERMRHFGGTVNIDSAPGSGTVVRVAVPLARPSASAVAEAKEFQHNLF
jgi:signal transduction histidine kinase/FixJ family two-component response regulator